MDMIGFYQMRWIGLIGSDGWIDRFGSDESVHIGWSDQWMDRSDRMYRSDRIRWIGSNRMDRWIGPNQINRMDGLHKFNNWKKVVDELMDG
ncbi:hypothetical protein DPMN_153394 [Dreissena polymorpha]|uniref:Uncharacterized protein n=1 Tax=Dreissena polymorpha TaxID=45954 RepID=A0A9D4FJ44_DREPO|nr:hypothetical protein DPMN_153394 [Dreissena polymorpha]